MAGYGVMNTGKFSLISAIMQNMASVFFLACFFVEEKN